MASKRSLIFMTILLVLVFAYITRPAWERYIYNIKTVHSEKPLAGVNKLSDIKIIRDENGKWIASFDFFYTGIPVPIIVSVKLSSDTGDRGKLLPLWSKVVERGTQKFKFEITRPYIPDGSALSTRKVVFQIAYGAEVISTQVVEQVIDWPDERTWRYERELSERTTDELLKRSVSHIDSGVESQLDEAKRLLERLIAKDAQFDPAYIELARIAMKSNWGPEGLHQAENLLASALKIRPESVNAKILLGYVYTHQKQFQKAEALFVDAAKSDTQNIWLWANWGGLLAMQGKLKLSEEKYREAVNRPKINDTYDLARLDAYSSLLAMLEKRKDIDGMEVLYKKRTAEFSNESCYSVEYAQFLLQQRGDAAAAIGLAGQSMEANCGISARDVLGLAHYLVWSGAKGEQRNSALDQARVFLPAGPRLLYLLSSSEQTYSGLKQLLSSGESIEQLDNNKFNALSYALSYKDLQAARRLIKLGARTDAPVGHGGIPVALIPVMNLDVEAIKIMQKLGVDYSKLRYKGATALDHAKQIGDKRLIELLSSGYEVI